MLVAIAGFRFRLSSVPRAMSHTACRRALGSVLGLVTGGLALGTPAQAHVRVGVMTCDMDSGFGYVLGSSRDLHCTFVPAAGGRESVSAIKPMPEAEIAK